LLKNFDITQRKATRSELDAKVVKHCNAYMEGGPCFRVCSCTWVEELFAPWSLGSITAYLVWFM